MANRHARGIVYVLTYVQTEYDRKNTRDNRYPFHSLTVDKILSMVLANKKIGKYR